MPYAFDVFQGWGISTGVHDLMAYPSVWPRDFTWQRLIGRLNDAMGGYNAFATLSPAPGTPAFTAVKDANGKWVIGKEEAQQIRKIFQGVDSQVCEDFSEGEAFFAPPETFIGSPLASETVLSAPITDLASGSLKHDESKAVAKPVGRILLERAVPTKIRKAAEMSRGRS